MTKKAIRKTYVDLISTYVMNNLAAIKPSTYTTTPNS